MASNFVTKEIESRIKQSPDNSFEVFLEIQQPINKEPPEILIKYPDDFSDQILKTAANFAYPCQMPPDDQSEHFTFVVLDSTGAIFRFGYCRRSSRESTCLFFVDSYYPWYEIFYNVLNDLSQIINSKSATEVEAFLSSLYNYKVLSNEEFQKNLGKERIEIHIPSKTYYYMRPDLDKLPSMLSNRNFSVMFSRLGPDIMLHLFAYLLFERRILFISSKLFHLTACACGCLCLINPMHWQNIFVPILPESMANTPQCSAPYIIGLHSSIYSNLNKSELGDVVVINIDTRTVESQYNDLNLFPKNLIRQMKKDLQQSLQLGGDHFARVFLRTMALIIGNYGSGFVIKNNKLDFDRDVYLKQYVGSDIYPFMSSIVNTQMFEQFSRYRTYAQLERDMEIDEFELEATNPLIEQVQNKAEKLHLAINKAGQKVVNEASAAKSNLTSLDINDITKRKISDPIESNHLTIPQLTGSDNLASSSSRSSTPDFEQCKTNSLINFDTDENLLLPSPIILEVIEKPLIPESFRQSPQIDSKIKHLQNELQNKIQTFDNKRIDPREEYTEEQQEIKQLVQQFDPFDQANTVSFRSDINISDRHPSLNETIPSNCVNNVLKNIQSNFGTNFKSTQPIEPVYNSSLSSDFDPLVSSTNNVYPHPPSSDTHGSNLIDFN
ncbi:unnamed protein product [Adineta steineri]|uniref:UDENN domain-containing protein n=1 Tax=Adineta steineri TaxID=433720 RepID=A0A819I1G2_9BILA|nr:unnamed protein product [Adineta steineri]